MDFDGFSTEVAVYKNKALYDDIVTRGMPLGNDGKELPSPMGIFGALIPKGAKNVTVAKDFLKYAVQPNVLNEYLKGGLGRWAIPMPEIAKADPFWFHEDPHRFCRGDADPSDSAALSGIQPGDGADRRRACLQHCHARCHEQRDDAGAGGRQGLQAGRGDLREISDHGGVRARNDGARR